jgi:hypothetical protein
MSPAVLVPRTALRTRKRRVGLRLGVCGGAGALGVSGVGPSGCGLRLPVGGAGLQLPSRMVPSWVGCVAGGAGSCHDAQRLYRGRAWGGFCGGRLLRGVTPGHFVWFLTILRAWRCLAMAFWPEEVTASRLSTSGFVVGLP